MKNRPFLQTAFLSLLGRTGGLLIPFLIAYFYGATVQTDAFFLAYSLSIAFMTLFSQMYESAMIPYLAVSQGIQSRCLWFIKSTLKTSLPLFSVLGFLLAWGLKPVLLRVGWSLEGASLVRQIMFAMQPFFWFGLGTAAWHALFYNRNIFWFPAVSPLVRALVVIGCIFGVHRLLGIHALTAGLALGEFLRFCLACRLGNSLGSLSTDGFKADETDRILLKKFYADAFWQMAALLAIHLMVVADQCFAQTAGDGRLTLLSYADRLIQIPYLLFLSGFLNIFHADWSQALAKSSSDLFLKLRRDLFWVLLGALLTAMILMVTAKLNIQLFYGKAAISEEEKSVLTGLFFWYALALIPGVLRLALGRVLIVMRASKFYFIQAWIELALNVTLNFFFLRLYGVAGIAMATAAVYFLSSIWLVAYIYSVKVRRTAV